MKKTMISLMVLLLLIVTGCGDSKAIVVKELEYNNETYEVSWLEVKGATEYLISINGEEIKVTDTTFSLKNYDQGIYKVKIKVEGMKKAIYTNELTVVVDKTSYVRLKQSSDTIMWESVPSATYTISFDSVGVVSHEQKDLKVNKYKIPKGFENETEITVTLKTYLSNQLISEDSFMIYGQPKKYSLENDITIKVNGLEEVLIDDKPATHFTYENGILTILKEEFSLHENKFLIVITGEESQSHVYDRTEKPALASPNTVKYEDADVDFLFVDAGFFIKQTSINEDGKAKELAKEEYTYVDGTLTFKKTFIEAYMEKYPDAELLIIMVAFTNNAHTQLFTVSIKLK